MLPKLDLACSKDDLRENMQYIQVTKETTTVVDVFILVTFPTKDVFGEDFTDSIENVFFIHSEDWKKLYKCELFVLDGDTLTGTGPKIKRPILIKVERCIKYPNWEAVIPSEDLKESVPSISITPSHLDTISKIIDPLKLGVKLEFNGKNKAINVSCLNLDYTGKALLMPRMT